MKKIFKALNLKKAGKRWSILILIFLLLSSLISAIICTFFTKSQVLFDYIIKIIDTFYPYWLVVSGGVALSGMIGNLTNNSQEGYCDRYAKNFSYYIST